MTDSSSAYEISYHWKQDPPPKEILEDLTAKGGGIMGRTLENFAKPADRETTKLANGDSDSDDADETTPKQEKVDGEDAGSAVGRSTRGE